MERDEVTRGGRCRLRKSDVAVTCGGGGVEAEEVAAAAWANR